MQSVPVGGDTLAQSWTGRLPSTAVIALLLLIGIVAAGDEIGHHITAIESWVLHLGPWGIPTFIVLFVLTASMLVPETALCVAAGALFGLWWGIAAVAVATVFAATVQYALACRALRARIQKAIASRPALLAIQRAVRADEVRLQVLLRLAPLNPATINYLLGAAGVRFSGFLVGLLALTPHFVVEVYFGHAGKHVARMAAGNRHVAYQQDAAIIGGLVVAAVGMVWLSTIARRAVMQAVATDSAAMTASTGC